MTGVTLDRPHLQLSRKRTMASLMTMICWLPPLGLSRLLMVQVVLKLAIAAGKHSPSMLPDNLNDPIMGPSVQSELGHEDLLTWTGASEEAADGSQRAEANHGSKQAAAEVSSNLCLTAEIMAAFIANCCSDRAMNTFMVEI